MSLLAIVIALLALSSLAYHAGKRRALQTARTEGGIRLHSLPRHYGLWTAIWCGVPSLLVLGLWLSFDQVIVKQLLVAQLPADLQSLSASRLNLVVNDIKNLASGNIVTADPNPAIAAAAEHYLELTASAKAVISIVALGIAIAGLAWGWSRINPSLRARNQVETVITGFLILSSTVATVTTVGIVLSVLFESIQFFEQIPATDFLFGLAWSPQTAIRADQVGSSGSFGAIPLFAGTLMISTIAMIVAAPIGLFSAIYLAEYASARVRAVVKPLLEVLSGIPTVVYGFFAALTVAPLLRDSGAFVGVGISSESALAAGGVMGFMLIPFVSSLSDDVINAVPQSLRDGSYGLGATQSETIKQVVLPAALPGIVGGFLLAISRAIGETMIVVMAAGLAANLTANPLETVTTVTVQMVTLLTGDQEFDSPKTLAAFALGLMLFVTTLILNIIALQVVRRYREQYD